MGFILHLSIQCNTIDFDAEIRHKITGVVVDADVNPIAGAKVSVHEVSSWESFVTYSTTQNGNFEGLIAGINNSIEQNYRLEIAHETGNQWATKSYYFSMKDQPNQTLNLSTIKIFPNENLKQVYVRFQMPSNIFKVENFTWSGDVALTEGTLYEGGFEYLNYCPANSQHTISYLLFNKNNLTKTTFTQTVNVLDENVEITLIH